MSLDLSATHFELFGLPPRFDLDLDALDRAYRAIQTEIHPDRFAEAGDAAQRQAVQWAAHANAAYATLKRPFERACYLLQGQGIDPLDPRDTRLPHDFLVKQMAWRETLAEAVAAHDAAALDRLEAETRAEARAALTELAALIDERQDYPGAAGAVRKYRFLEKFLADLGEAHEQID